MVERERSEDLVCVRCGDGDREGVSHALARAVVLRDADTLSDAVAVVEAQLDPVVDGEAAPLCDEMVERDATSDNVAQIVGEAQADTDSDAPALTVSPAEPDTVTNGDTLGDSESEDCALRERVALGLAHLDAAPDTLVVPQPDRDARIVNVSVG